MSKPQISRRTFLAAATAVAVPAVPASAAATHKPHPKPRTSPRTDSRLQSAPRQDITTQQGDANIMVSIEPEQDVAAIRYTLANVGAAPDTFTVWYTDQNNGRQSRKLVYPLDPSQLTSATVYGAVDHTFVLNVCQSDGMCFTVGPFGPAAQVAGPARGLTARPNQWTAGPNISVG